MNNFIMQVQITGDSKDSVIDGLRQVIQDIQNNHFGITNDGTDKIMQMDNVAVLKQNGGKFKVVNKTK